MTGWTGFLEAVRKVGQRDDMMRLQKVGNNVAIDGELNDWNPAP